MTDDLSSGAPVPGDTPHIHHDPVPPGALGASLPDAERYLREAATWPGFTDGALPLLLAEHDRRAVALAERDAEIARLRQVIREYVAHVESGERFDALVSAVPGLESDDGVYPIGEIDRLRAEIARLRAHVDACALRVTTAPREQTKENDHE